MPHYSQKTTNTKKLKSFENKFKFSHAELETAFDKFSENSTFKFYDGDVGKKKKKKKLKSPKKAKKRSFTFALKAILQSLEYIESRRNVRKSNRDVLRSLLTESSSKVSRQASDSELRINLTYKFIEHLFECHHP